MSGQILLVVLLLLNTVGVLGFLFSTPFDEDVDLERAHRTDYCGSYRIRFQFDIPGCLPKSVVTQACKGVCRSYAIPG